MMLTCSKSALFMGERIEDVYEYGRLMHRPVKEPIQCIMLEGREVFAGGVQAAAEHASAFCPLVHVHAERLVKKVRFLESSHKRKLFEHYEPAVRIAHGALPEAADIIAVCDYGHGMMTPERVEWVQAQPAFRAAAVQTNAGNLGFNLATKYDNLDYLCVDEYEARLATQNQGGDILNSLADLSMIAPTVCITLGAAGAIGCKAGDVARAPAFANNVRDTMGAGDAFFAVTALFAAELPIAELLRLGNAAAAVKTRSVGQKPITRAEVEALLASA